MFYYFFDICYYMEEIWKDIVGYEGYYLVSSFGRIKNKKEKIIFQTTTHHGYKRTVLQKKGIIKNFFVHRIVAESFIGPRPDGYQVNHKNLIRSDNNFQNLEYVTDSQNKKHSWLRRKNFYEITDNKKFRVKIWYKNKHFCFGTYNTPEEAEEVYKKKHFELFGY